MSEALAAPVPRLPDDGTSSGVSKFGLAPLGAMPEAEFQSNLAALARSLERLNAIKSTLMNEGVDFGVIPGTGNKPTLLQPGAQILCFAARLAPSFWVERTTGIAEEEPDIHYRVTCRLHLGDTSGPCIGEGVGSANSFEKKYRYRVGQRECPECLKPTVMRSKYPNRETGEKGWYCNAKRDGCGAEFPPDDPRILEQQEGQVENPDPHDMDNTLLKMAKKRAFVDAALTCTASSGYFTQDLEDAHEGEKSQRESLLQRIGIAARKLGTTKNQELWALAAKKLGLAKAVDPTQLTTARLTMLADALEADAAANEVKPAAEAVTT